jgi:hypothetical protein
MVITAQVRGAFTSCWESSVALSQVEVKQNFDQHICKQRISTDNISSETNISHISDFNNIHDYL